jgi:pimeloyl-ACP methyl ester carboxylesterase
MTRHTVEIAGSRLSWLQSGQGRPVLLVHGFPLHAEMWRPLHDTTPHGWQLLTPDLRNLGRSVGPPAMSVDDHADDVLALLRHSSIERAVIGGLSMGGYVAMAVHRKAPQRCEALVLADTRAEPDGDEARAGRVAAQATAREKGAVAVLEGMLPKLLGRRAASEGTVPARLREMAAGNRPDGVVDALEALRTRPDARPFLPAVACPALVLVGEDDGLTPPAAAGTIASAIPGATLRVLPDAGHMSSLEAPDAFAAELWGFVTALPR